MLKPERSNVITLTLIKKQFHNLLGRNGLGGPELKEGVNAFTSMELATSLTSQRNS